MCRVTRPHGLLADRRVDESWVIVRPALVQGYWDWHDVY
jgi:hypothetical protein